MGEVSTIGLDIAKSVFQVHGVDADGAVVIRKRISRAKVLEFFAALPSCLVGVEACPERALLEPQTSSSRPRGEADATELCESLSQAEQKRRQRCSRDLRGSNTAVDAFRANKI